MPHKPRRRPGRRAGREAEQPEAVPLTRVTVVLSDRPFENQERAARWMKQRANDAAARAGLLARAAAVVNRALHALAVSKQDPYVPQLSPAQALAARIGHGLGPELAEGNFTEALPIPTDSPSRRRRIDEVAPQERLAAILGGREQPNCCETFLLRARVDFDAGRLREATLGLAAAVDSMLLELGGERTAPGQESDLSLLSAQRADLVVLADAARLGPLEPAAAARVDDLLALCERILRRRRLAPEIR